MKNRTIEEITEKEFLSMVKKICDADYGTEAQHTKAVLEFEKISEHPNGSDLIYYPQPSVDDSPEGIVETIKKWRAANGKPDFKKET
jgi:hypothetical protein